MVLGNSFANAAMVGLAFWMVVRGDWPLASTSGLVLVWVLVGCEVLPKTMAVRRPEQWSLRVAHPLARLHTITRPLRQLAQSLVAHLLRLALPKSLKPAAGPTDEDYRELLELAQQQGSLAATEKEIILQILDLDRRTVKEVMRPRAQMACISDELTVEEMVEAARRHQHRRLPVYDGTPDTIVGVLNTRELLLNPGIDLVDAIEFPSFVPESMNLLQLLKSLQRQQRGLAIVLDEYGATAGVVTMEDILEAMVGQIRSEGGAEGFIMERLGPGRWRVNGTMRLDDFRREYPALGEVAEVETMGGLMMHQLGVVPAAGERVGFRGLSLTAQAVDERRVREVLVELGGAGKGRA
jgi:putative hemolysin